MWCARGVPGGVAAAWTNLGGDDVYLSLGGLLDGQARVEYTLTSTAAPGAHTAGGPPPSSLQDDAAFLNGALLTVDPTTGLLPEYPIPGRAVQRGSGAPLLTPAYAYGFAVYPDANVPACA